MVAPDSAASSNEALELHRRSLTAAAIRRGDVKISEPIPWEDGLNSPLSSGQRKPPNPGGSKTNIAVAQYRPEETGAPKTNVAVGQHKSVESLAHGRNAGEGEEMPKPFEGGPPLRHKRASLSMRGDSEAQEQAKPVQARRESGFTDSPAGSPSQMQSKKKRQSGTIRTVFKRLFSKRDKGRHSGYTEEKKTASPGSRQHGYHGSVSLIVRTQDLQLIRIQDPLPKALNRGVGDIKEPYGDGANNSPIKPLPAPPPGEYPPSTPVQQRLPFPMNVNAPLPESPSPHYTNFNSPLVHRRRATLPSVVISSGDAVAIRELMGWAKPAANLTSPADRNAIHRPPSSLIGVAVTSGANPNRRSRSAGALYDMAREQDPSEQRRRSAEIEHWRQSYVAPDSEVTAPENQPDAVKSSESHADMEHESIISDHHSGTEISAALADAGSSIRDEPVIQAQDFAAPVPPSREGLTGTSEAEATPTVTTSTNQSDALIPGMALNQRLSQIEDNMRTLTSSIQELTGRAHRHTVTLESTPRGSRDRVVEQRQQPPLLEQEEQQVSPGLPANPKDLYPGRALSRHFQQPSPPSSGASIASAKGATHVPSEGYLFSPSTGAPGTNGGRPVTHQQDSHFLSPESLSFSPEPTTPELATRERELHAQYAHYSSDTANIPPSLPSPNIYTHLAPLYSALRYERNQRKTIEARIAQLSQQVSDLMAVTTDMQSTGNPRSTETLTRPETSRFSGYDDSADEAEVREERMEMVTPMEEWPTPTQDWSADAQHAHGHGGSDEAGLGSPIEGEMF